MNCPLFKDNPTSNRVLISNVRRVVYARYDHEGNFVRYVIQRTEAEMNRERKSYAPAKVGILSWMEVYPHNFS